MGIQVRPFTFKITVYAVYCHSDAVKCMYDALLQLMMALSLSYDLPMSLCLSLVSPFPCLTQNDYTKRE